MTDYPCDCFRRDGRCTGKAKHPIVVRWLGNQETRSIRVCTRCHTALTVYGTAIALHRNEAGHPISNWVAPIEYTTKVGAKGGPVLVRK